MQLLQAALCRLAQTFDVPELNGLSRASFRAGRLQSNFLAVVAKCALERPTIFIIAFHDSKRTGGHTISAAVTNVGLNEDSTEFGAHYGTRRTSFEASRLLAMFADIG